MSVFLVVRKSARVRVFFRSGFRGTRGKYTRQTSTKISIAVPREICCGCDRMENSAVRVTGYRFCNTIDSCSIQRFRGCEKARFGGTIDGNVFRKRVRLRGKSGAMRSRIASYILGVTGARAKNGRASCLNFLSGAS